MKKLFLLSYTHIIAVILFVLISYIYFLPQLQNEVLHQSDVINYKGMSKEIFEYREQFNKEPLWTSRPFCGMPSYLISIKHPGNQLRFLRDTLFIGKPPASYMIMALIGFYIALLIFGLNPWLSMAGAMAYGLSTFFIIFFEAGHNTKIQAIGLIPIVISSFYMIYRKSLWLGLVMAGIFLGFQIYINHPQMVYYTAIAIFLYILFEFIYSLKNKEFPSFIKKTVLLLIPILLAVGCNISSLWTTYEYSKYSTRSKSDLIIDEKNQTSGLDKDYATEWSYGIDETLTILIPNFKGGASYGKLSTNSMTYKVLKQNNIPNAKKIIKQMHLYHGDQLFTSGPIYFGAIIIFLFFIGAFLVNGPIKKWLVSIVIIAILFSWGKNFMFLTDLLMDYLPGYNKFRDVKMIMVIAMFAMPLLGFLGLKQIISREIIKDDVLKILKRTFFICEALLLFLVLFPGIFDFSASTDTQLPDWLIEAVKTDRKILLRNDAFRSFIFIFIGATAIWLFLKEKLKTNYLIIIIGLLILIDLWTVDKRYVNNEQFVKQKAIKEPFILTEADNYILMDKDPDYRVLNLTVSPFQDASTCYFHKSLGGYHGAKMKRYQELIEIRLYNEIQQLINTFNNKDNTIISLNNALMELNVMNMLNTKYIIYNKNARPLYNIHSNGSVWFVDSLIVAEDANEEIEILNQINTKKIAVTDKIFSNIFSDFVFKANDSASIKLTYFLPNNITYNSYSSTDQLAVFSEIYYPKGWNAYIDGKLHDYFRVNYVLRGMIIPAGEHNIEFKFEPESHFLGSKISFASSLILVIMLIGVILNEYLKVKKHK